MSPDEEVISALIEREGDYVDHPADKGGPTRWGITLKALAEWRKGEVSADDVRHLSIDEARKIYAQRYLIDTGIWRINHPALRACVLDAAVNHGPATAIKLLQRTLGVNDDGALGDKSLAAIPHLDPWKLVAKYTGRRCRYYGDIVAGHQEQRVFAAGWFRRVADLVETI